MSPERICYGLSRIGYTPDSAICDILDNAVVAHAKNIYIVLHKKDEHASDRRINNVKEYLIIDDGDGMTQTGIQNALSLGSDSSNYTDGTLSKFGLGLKSAAFAQGNRLEVISSPGNSKYHKLIVDLEQITEEYFAFEEPLSEADQSIIDAYIQGTHGTIIRVTNIHQNNHPSIRSTKHLLEKRLGIIYYYFIQDSNLRILLDDEAIKPYDVLFTHEANQNGNLDESTWDGKSVKWISRAKDYTVDTQSGASCTIEVTQLPYPPIFELDGQDKASVRKKYNIASGNYGYYVYRNKRLISWAESFNGIIPQDLKYYSFRGRILIESDADDCFNIDVKKSNLALSDEAFQVIEEVSDQLKKKSKSAWEHAKRLLQKRIGQTPNQLANDIAAGADVIDDLPEDLIFTVAEEQKKQQRIIDIEKDYKKKLRLETQKRLRNTTGKEVSQNEIGKQEVDETLRGLGIDTDHIFLVDYLEDNILWAPYYDAEKGVCVRINRNHRFARLIYEDNVENADLQIILNLLLWQLANTEIHIQTHRLDFTREQIEGVTTEYRRVASELLAHLCRTSSASLPPANGEM